MKFKQLKSKIALKYHKYKQVIESLVLAGVMLITKGSSMIPSEDLEEHKHEKPQINNEQHVDKDFNDFELPIGFNLADELGLNKIPGLEIPGEEGVYHFGLSGAPISKDETSVTLPDIDSYEDLNEGTNYSPGHGGTSDYDPSGNSNGSNNGEGTTSGEDTIIITPDVDPSVTPETPGENEKPDEVKPDGEDNNTNTPDNQGDENKPVVPSDGDNTEINKPGEDESNKPDKPDKPDKPGEDDKHYHTLGYWYSYDDEHERRYCTSCDYFEERNHDFYYNGSTVKSNHDGTHAVIDYNKCGNCGHIVTIINNVPCSYGEVEYNKEYAYETCKTCGDRHITCTHDFDVQDDGLGTITYTCNNGCGYSYTENYTPGHTTHTLGEWTSYDDEHERRYCSECDYYEEQGHDYVSSFSDYSYNGNETHSRTETQTCNTCGHTHSNPITYTDDCTFGDIEYDSTNAYEICSVCGGKHITCTHDFDVQDDGLGTITYTCNNGCGYSYTENYTPGHTTHTLGEWTSYDDEHERRYCSECDYYEERGHDYVSSFSDYSYNGNETHSRTETQTCNTCGHTHSNPITHTDDCTFGDIEYDSTNAYEICSVCGGKHITCTHSIDEGIDDGLGTITYTCENGCGYSYETHYTPPVHEHTPGERIESGAVTADGCYHVTVYCTDCGEKIVDEDVPHEIDPNSIVHGSTADVGCCIRCGAEMVIPHVNSAHIHDEELNQESIALLAASDIMTNRGIKDTNMEAAEIKIASDIETQARIDASDEETRALLEATDAETQALLARSDAEARERLIASDIELAVRQATAPMVRALIKK